MNPEYPDIKLLLAAKSLRRQELAALSWEEKVAIIERMRRLLPAGAWHKRTLTTPNSEFDDSIGQDALTAAATVST